MVDRDTTVTPTVSLFPVAPGDLVFRFSRNPRPPDTPVHTPGRPTALDNPVPTRGSRRVTSFATTPGAHPGSRAAPSLPPDVPHRHPYLLIPVSRRTQSLSPTPCPVSLRDRVVSPLSESDGAERFWVGPVRSGRGRWIYSTRRGLFLGPQSHLDATYRVGRPVTATPQVPGPVGLRPWTITWVVLTRIITVKKRENVRSPGPGSGSLSRVRCPVRR